VKWIFNTTSNTDMAGIYSQFVPMINGLGFFCDVSPYQMQPNDGLRFLIQNTSSFDINSPTNVWCALYNGNGGKKLTVSGTNQLTQHLFEYAALHLERIQIGIIVTTTLYYFFVKIPSVAPTWTLSATLPVITLMGSVRLCITHYTGANQLYKASIPDYDYTNQVVGATLGDSGFVFPYIDYYQYITQLIVSELICHNIQGDSYELPTFFKNRK
jgi:hypothetical protein